MPDPLMPNPAITTQPWDPPLGVPDNVRALKNYILERLPALPPWVIERRFKAEANALFVSDRLDIAHKDNPHVKLGEVSRVPNYDRQGNPKPVWYEAGFPWDVAAQKWGAEVCQYLRFSDWHYVIQRPVG